ncbi:MAG: alpha/beta fold hydrolase [Gammaproteobacteria bacterium]|nr:alpha/beta fold hydrolase [Gammaproteobacteria bacterium]
MALEAITLDTGTNPDRAVIWLHGLGASGHDFEPVVDKLDLPGDMQVRFIFPHAPVRAVTLNDGAWMPAWYDLYGLGKDDPEDTEGLEQSKTELDALVEQLAQSGIPPRRVVLAGFSQGGALGLYTGLSCGQRLAGVLALSCYLPLRQVFPDYAAMADRSLPIFVAHGSYDEMISIDAAKFTCERLEQQGFSVTLQTYPCDHTVCQEEIADIREWLLQCWQ